MAFFSPQLPPETISELQHELNIMLQRTQRKRNTFIIVRTLCYGLAVIYVLGLLIISFLPNTSYLFTHDYVANPNPTFWEANKLLCYILPMVILIVITSGVMAWLFPRLAEAREDALRRILRRLFPDASISLEVRPISPYVLNDTLLFSRVSEEDTAYNPLSVTTIKLKTGEQETTIHDLAILMSKNSERLAQTVLGGLTLLNGLIRTILSRSEEAEVYQFRGMWAQTSLEKIINGGVVVLPDHWEGKFGYLAQNIQSLTTKNGCKLVRMEDVEFENYFAVYATDDFLARYILTPFVMQRLCELRNQYGRDIMLSFTGNQFNFAVSMSSGMFGFVSGEENTAVSDLYNYLSTTANILSDLRLHWNTK